MKKTYFLTLILFFIGINLSVAQRKLETLNRGLIAVRTTTDQVYIGWRLLGYENQSTAFNVYRDGVLINDTPIENSTNFIDTVSSDGSYQVKTVINGEEKDTSESVDVLQQDYLEIPLNTPDGGITPDNVSYTYTANDASVGDLDGDGQYEIILKWDPTNSKDNSHEGYTGNVYLDAYTLEGEFKWRIDLGHNIRAGAHYTQFIVFDFDGDGKSEIACKTADGTIDGQGKIIGDATADYRNSAGRVLSGPEFLTIFNGETGAEMATVDYLPARGDVSSWGDNYGNRVDRFLAGVAFLDGKNPSLVMCRGYYTRSVLAAWDWKDGKLTQRWIFDSNDEENKGYGGQGNHSLSIADVDADGKDEIIYGSMTVDDDGTGLYNTGLGHGDALHVSDFDPERPGQEVFMPHENKVDGITFRSAKTGDIIWQYKMNTDVGRGLIADIDSTQLGAESWASSGLGVYNSKGVKVLSDRPSINFAIWWDDDLQRELLDGTSITKYGVGEVFNATDCNSNNSTKKTPNLQADLLGDWREELMLRTSDNKALRIFLNPTKSKRKMYTLMHDPQYRVAIAWQNVGYNQPPWPSFYLGYGMDTPPPAPLTNNKLIWNKGDVWDIEKSSNWFLNDNVSEYHQEDVVLFDESGETKQPIQLVGDITPTSVTFNSASNYILTGEGHLTGTMELVKLGNSNVFLNNSNTFTGTSTVWQGGLFINGNLENSSIIIKDYATFGGEGIVGKTLNLGKGVHMYAGEDKKAGILTVNGAVTIKDGINFNFDLSDDPIGLNDKLVFNESVQFNGDVTFVFNTINDGLNSGTYTLIEYGKDFDIDLDNVKVEGIPGIKYELNNTGATITMEVEWVRNPTTVYWRGNTSNVWDLAETYNWYNGTDSDLFAPSDYVIFDDSGASKNTIETSGTLPIGQITVNSDSDYFIQGDGSINGDGGLLKQGDGTLYIKGNHNFTGITTIEGGKISVDALSNGGESGSIGAASNLPENLQINGGTLEFSSNIETDRGILTLDKNATIIAPDGVIAILNGEISGKGKLEKTGTGQIQLNNKNTILGNVILKEGIIHLGSEESISHGFNDGNIVLEGGMLSMLDDTNSFSKAYWNVIIPEEKQAEWRLDGRCEFRGTLRGAGILNLYAPWIRSEMYGDWSEFNGHVNVTTDSDGGWFILGNKNGYVNTSINLADGVSILFRLDSNETIELGELSGTSNSFLSSGYGSRTLTWKVGGKNTDAIFNGVIDETAFKGSGSKTAIIKSGSGTWTLTNSNTYSGGTKIEAGELIVDNTIGSGTGTGMVTVDAHAILSGNGSMDGNLLLQDDAILAPGRENIVGQLRFSKDVSFSETSILKIDINDNSYDKITTSGTLKYNGILHINNLGNEFKEGDRFAIFDAETIEGKFADITPALTNNLAWDTSELYTNGVLIVNHEDNLSISDDDLNKNRISFFPNPTQDYLNISLQKNPGLDSQILVYDCLGHLLVKESFNKDKYQLSLEHLSSGMYIIKVKNTEGVITKTIIKD
ncbi:rhamnogalacturonan lyase family protein [Formosa haliotis]|uniref:rhamnogalacturonan lyase family protein n=1 Tax=Formosa haliotis TaxID=1555194 RepID=UPI000825AA8A|nr:autotransporter-associated beta strand repeat-containing protein [Formosa haliotis]